MGPKGERLGPEGGRAGTGIQVHSSSSVVRVLIPKIASVTAGLRMSGRIFQPGGK
jgi:hypothetical protein